MYVLSMGAGMTMGFPDVCLTPVPTPAGPIPTPIPYPNTGTTAMTPASVKNVLMGCTPTVNQMASIAMTSGDEAGALTGVVSHMIKGQGMWILGSTSLLVGGMPAMRLTSVGGGNAMGLMPNCPATCIVPSQFITMALR
ncbi:MAG: DUF4150 domain-containing protein [Burkholderiaceae bacterium]|jgi:hypothetical protein|nr:DUF4150 domain-containing protein [Burkholderiaceae bacterium]